MQTRMECQNTLTHLVERSPAVLFASIATMDGRSYAYSNAISSGANPQRAAAITSSLMSLADSFSREALESAAKYHCIATEEGSIVIVRVPSRTRAHTLCLCSDASESLGMTIRAALDAADALAATFDAETTANANA